MTTTEQRLADALRAVLPFAERDVGELCDLVRDDDSEAEANAASEYLWAARQALAAYDAWPERMATDYRVTTEWDAFDADSPRAAAVEVWQRIRESAGPVFTVRCSDGRILDVDLSDETDEGVEA